MGRRIVESMSMEEAFSALNSKKMCAITKVENKKDIKEAINANDSDQDSYFIVIDLMDENNLRLHEFQEICIYKDINIKSTWNYEFTYTGDYQGNFKSAYDAIIAALKRYKKDFDVEYVSDYLESNNLSSVNLRIVFDTNLKNILTSSKTVEIVRLAKSLETLDHVNAIQIDYQDLSDDILNAFTSY